MHYEVVLDFWFSQLSEKERFSGGQKVDDLITQQFLELHSAVVANECFEWRTTALGSLAEIIVLDQFSRNIYRGKREAFAADGQALALAQVAIEKGFVEQLSESETLFLYMPFMHSESSIIHNGALRLFTALGNDSALQYEKLHKDIIDEFGRYPHRNEQLGRENTAEETAYLKDTTEDFFAS